MIDNHKCSQTDGFYLKKDTMITRVLGIVEGTLCPAFQYHGRKDLPDWFDACRNWSYAAATNLKYEFKINDPLIIKYKDAAFDMLVTVGDWVVINTSTNRLYVYKPEVFKNEFVLVQLATECSRSWFDTTKPKE